MVVEPPPNFRDGDGTVDKRRSRRRAASSDTATECTASSEYMPAFPQDIWPWCTVAAYVLGAWGGGAHAVLLVWLVAALAAVSAEMARGEFWP